MHNHKDLDGQLYLDMEGNTELENCLLEQKEVYRNVTVEILECPICGKTSIGWYRQDNTEQIV